MTKVDDDNSPIGKAKSLTGLIREVRLIEVEAEKRALREAEEQKNEENGNKPNRISTKVKSNSPTESTRNNNAKDNPQAQRGFDNDTAKYYYVSPNRETKGPFTSTQIQELYVSHVINDATPIVLENGPASSPKATKPQALKDIAHVYSKCTIAANNSKTSTATAIRPSQQNMGLPQLTSFDDDDDDDDDKKNHNVETVHVHATVNVTAPPQQKVGLPQLADSDDEDDGEGDGEGEGNNHKKNHNVETDNMHATTNAIATAIVVDANLFGNLDLTVKNSPVKTKEMEIKRETESDVTKIKTEELKKKMMLQIKKNQKKKKKKLKSNP